MCLHCQIRVYPNSAVLKGVSTQLVQWSPYRALASMVAGPSEDLREMVARLEQQELDCQTGSGTVPTTLYTELLAAYLAEGELNKSVVRLLLLASAHSCGYDSLPLVCGYDSFFSLRAKFLWKRIPAAVKQEGELPRVWTIGKGECWG